VAGKPLYGWDSRDHRLRTVYDVLRRLTEVYLQEGGAPELLVGKTVYGEDQPNTEANNLRGKSYQSFDGAGVVTTDEYDFKGNLLSSSRQLAVDYKNALNWLVTVALEVELFTVSTIYDALNRPVTLTTPDNSVIRPVFNEANLLNAVDANLRGEALNGQLVWTPFVTNIDYNAKGQRERIEYKNGATTRYDYDDETFRLTQLTTTRRAGGNGLASALFTNPAIVQDLRYTYDPAGNITEIADAAIAEVIHNSQSVRAASHYTYDAIYRLISAEGREHIGQTAFASGPPNGNRRDYPFVGLQTQQSNPKAVRNYVEDYVYDAVSNIERVGHRAGGSGWTRAYTYAEPSLLDTSETSNRLTRTTVGNTPETYGYKDAQGNDVNGCMTSINAMQLVWDFEDQLQRVDLGGGGTAYYVYDAAGQRVRKVWEKAPGLTEECIYLGGFEVYRKRNGNGSVTLDRETLHLMDGQQRIAMVETRTQGDDGSPAQLVRYQFSNHRGSASLELDEKGAIISYEEYYPYGSTSYQAVDKSIKAAAKRYRYTRMEREEETGLSYHGARYYACWLGRWCSVDPAELIDGINGCVYVRNNPITSSDPSGLATDDSEPEIDLSHLSDDEARQYLEEAGGFIIDEAAPESWLGSDRYRVFQGWEPGSEDPRWYRLYNTGEVEGTSVWDENKTRLLGRPGGLFGIQAVELLRGGPSVAAEEVTIGIAVGGLINWGVAGYGWAKSVTNFDDIADAGLMGAQEGAAEAVEAMNPFGPHAAGASAQPPVLKFIGLGTDASGQAIITLDEIAEAANDVGAQFVHADAISEMGRNNGRLWLGRYGSGAVPGGRYPKAGLQLLEGYAKEFGGRTGAIDLSKVPRADWFANIQPLIDNADEVMFHVSTGVGVVDEASGIQYLTSEELLYGLNNSEVASKIIFFYITPLN
jgi:RHS repeat-associated protein